jgi:hypothetical protein
MLRNAPVFNLILAVARRTSTSVCRVNAAACFAGQKRLMLTVIFFPDADRKCNRCYPNSEMEEESPHVMMNSLSAAWRADQDHRKVLTIAENMQCSTQKSSVKQIGDLAVLLPPFREVDENED